jgi:uncharacterized membrane protein YeaQ/YmgE (transglycosylase-associated protein family)
MCLTHCLTEQLKGTAVGVNSGALGKQVMLGDDPGGTIVIILVKLAGAYVGGFMTQSLLGLGSGRFIWSIILAILGAIILPAVYRLVVGRAST